MRLRASRCSGSAGGSGSGSDAVGKTSLTQRYAAAPTDRSREHALLDAVWSSGKVQLSGDPYSGMSDGEVQSTAAHGLSAASQALPHLPEIQRSFGDHDVSGVQAHVGGAAGEANAALGAHAYATGDHVAFAESPSLALAAHEAAHVVQQRSGVQLSSAVGQAGDSYEQQADAVAARVVAGESAADLLGSVGGASNSAVQRKVNGGQTASGGKVTLGKGETTTPKWSVEGATKMDDGSYAINRGEKCVVRLQLIGAVNPKEDGYTVFSEERGEGPDLQSRAAFEIGVGKWDGNDLIWGVAAHETGTTKGYFRVNRDGTEASANKEYAFTSVGIPLDFSIDQGLGLVENALNQMFAQRQLAITHFHRIEGLEDPKSPGNALLGHFLTAALSFATTAIGALVSGPTLGLGGIVAAAMTDFVKDGLSSVIEAALQADPPQSKVRLLLGMEKVATTALQKQQSVALVRITRMLADWIKTAGGEKARPKVIAELEAALCAVEVMRAEAYEVQVDELTQAWATMLANSTNSTTGEPAGEDPTNKLIDVSGGTGALSLDAKLGKPGLITPQGARIPGLNQELTGYIAAHTFGDLKVPRFVRGVGFEYDDLAPVIAGRGDVVGRALDDNTSVLVDIFYDEHGVPEVGGQTTTAGRIWLLRTAKPDLSEEEALAASKDEARVAAGARRVLALLAKQPVKPLLS